MLCSIRRVATTLAATDRRKPDLVSPTGQSSLDEAVAPVSTRCEPFPPTRSWCPKNRMLFAMLSSERDTRAWRCLQSYSCPTLTSIGNEPAGTYAATT